MSEMDWSEIALEGIPGSRAKTFSAKVEGYCVIQMPDGIVYSATADTNEVAAMDVLQQMKRYYSRDFKLTGEIDGKQINISTCA